MVFKTKQIIILILTIITISCNSVDSKKIQIIEGIQLGTTYKKYQLQLDSLGIKNKQFFTNLLINSTDDISTNIIDVYISDVFDLSDYRNNNNHFTLLYPIRRTGTDNVIGLNAILGHTANSFMFTSTGIKDLTKEYGIKNFNQNISSDLMNEIKKMLESKYGQPIYDKIKSPYNSFFVLQKGEIKEYNGDDVINGALTTWENEFITVELFEGVPSFTAVINDNGYQLSEPLFSSSPTIKKPNLDKGERSCVSYVYIRYELKQEIIEKLKLEDKKL